MFETLELLLVDWEALRDEARFFLGRCASSSWSSSLHFRALSGTTCAIWSGSGKGQEPVDDTLFKKKGNLRKDTKAFGLTTSMLI